MNINEIIATLKKQKPELLGTLPDKKAAALLREALLLIRGQIADTDEGVVKVPGFGSFHLRQVQREKDGQEVAVKQIRFHAAAPKSPQE